jgi:hypothetical protein
MPPGAPQTLMRTSPAKFYAAIGFSHVQVAALFAFGLITTALLSPCAPSVVERVGRRQACLLYCIICSVGCAMKLSTNLSVLLGSRVLDGIASALLGVAVDAWVVCEHRRVVFPEEWLGNIFAAGALTNSLAAVAAGVLSWVVTGAFRCAYTRRQHTGVRSPLGFTMSRAAGRQPGDAVFDGGSRAELWILCDPSALGCRRTATRCSGRVGSDWLHVLLKRGRVVPTNGFGADGVPRVARAECCRSRHVSCLLRLTEEESGCSCGAHTRVRDRTTVVFLWTPLLTGRYQEHSKGEHLSLGLSFSCFMVALLLGR